MLVNVPQAGLDVLLYNTNHQSIGNYVMQQLAVLPQHLTAFGSKIIEGAKTTYNYLTNELLNRTIQARVSDSNVYLDNNQIQAYSSFAELQNASLSNQRYLIANPHLRTIFNNQGCDGYSSTYIDPFKGKIGAEHYDYRRVMDGVLTDDPDHAFKVQFFDEQLEFGDRELLNHERTSILRSWKTIDWLLETSPFDFTNSVGEVKMNKP